jgi:glycine hydroxymethyltransferase
MNELIHIDPIINNLITRESERQKKSINLIASENYAPQAVLEATGSVLTNKYAEGYPHKRYYGGCEIIDEVELIAIERVKKLFNAEHANVQPHAGSQANLASYYTFIKPGDSIMGMRLSEGGHLTHGHASSITGNIYTVIPYTVNRETELLDYEKIAQLAEQYKPKLIIAGASAYSRIIDFEQIATIANNTGAYFMADIAHIAGPIAAGLHPTPIGHADVITSTTHKTLRGPRGGLIMCKKEYAQAIDKAIMPGTQGGPCMNTIAAKAVAFKLALEPSFIEYQKNILANAKQMALSLAERGYRIVTGGTDNHLFIVDVRTQGLTGKEAESALSNVGIIVNRNTIPFDPQKAWISSGIRIGTPAMTTRGMTPTQAEYVAELIDETLTHRDNNNMISRIRTAVNQLCEQLK